jgi:hypothetical protein
MFTSPPINFHILRSLEWKQLKIEEANTYKTDEKARH